MADKEKKVAKKPKKIQKIPKDITKTIPGRAPRSFDAPPERKPTSLFIPITVSIKSSTYSVSAGSQDVLEFIVTPSAPLIKNYVVVSEILGGPNYTTSSPGPVSLTPDDGFAYVWHPLSPPDTAEVPFTNTLALVVKLISGTTIECISATAFTVVGT